MNIIGERQHPEKFLPTIMRKIIKNEKVPLFGNNKMIFLIGIGYMPEMLLMQ